jgi:hypothetical protein
LVTTRIAEIIAANSKLGIRGIRAELERRWGLGVRLGSPARETSPSVRDVLARVVAAREELALGAAEEAAAMLADLEVDLAVLIGRTER